MSDLSLTAERRHELADLLGDDDRLRTAYPQVADYLDMAPRLPGTGNHGADAAFDLRFVHYMTGGESPTGNPYWDIVGPAVSSRDGRRVLDGGSQNGSARLAYAQTILQATFAYAVPSPESVAWVAEFCAGRPVVELGAGRGYWAAQLSRTGIGVSAYDSEPPGATANPSFPRASGQADVWHEVSRADELPAVSDDAVLFLCWPPGWGDTMASQALQAFEAAGGRQLVYIGEPKQGKTGDDAFFEGLASRWDLQATDDAYVSWWNLRDRAEAWVLR